MLIYFTPIAVNAMIINILQTILFRYHHLLYANTAISQYHLYLIYTGWKSPDINLFGTGGKGSFGKKHAAIAVRQL